MTFSFTATSKALSPLSQTYWCLCTSSHKANKKGQKNVMTDNQARLRGESNEVLNSSDITS